MWKKIILLMALVGLVSAQQNDRRCMGLSGKVCWDDINVEAVSFIAGTLVSSKNYSITCVEKKDSWGTTFLQVVSEDKCDKGCFNGYCDNYIPPKQTIKKNVSMNYYPRINMNINDFLGDCDENKLQGLNIVEFGACIGSAFDPRIPNPISIFAPISGDALDAKLEAVNFMPFDGDGNFSLSMVSFDKLISSLWNVPIVVAITFIELIFNTLKFMLVFIIRFVFVYLFYISIGYQSLMNYLNMKNKLTSKDKITYTVFIMSVVSIIGLAYGVTPLL